MAQLINVKLSRFDGSPWGFRLQGGKDFGTPLVVQKVNTGSPAEAAGLKAGDAVIRVNNTEVYNLRHKDAQDVIVRAGNNFELTVQRGGGTWKPHVTPISSSLPSPSPTGGLGNIAPVTKTSLAANKKDGPHIGSGHNFSPKPFLNGTGDGSIKSIVNKQYNSPVGIYSEETIAETLSAQAEVLAGGVLGVNFKKNEKNYNAENSEVFKMVQEADKEPKTPEPAEPTAQSGVITPSSPALAGLRPVSAPETKQQQPSTPQSSLPPGQNICAECERLIVTEFYSSVSHAVGGRATSPRSPTPLFHALHGNPAFNSNEYPSSKRPAQRQESSSSSPVSSGVRCSNCDRVIVGVFVRIKDKNLHVECFKCSTCGTSLKNVVGYYNINNKLYCDIHAKLVARQNAPAGLVPITIPPGGKAPASTISAALANAPLSPPLSNHTSSPQPFSAYNRSSPDYGSPNSQLSSPNRNGCITNGNCHWESKTFTSTITIQTGCTEPTRLGTSPVDPPSFRSVQAPTSNNLIGPKPFGGSSTVSSPPLLNSGNSTLPRPQSQTVTENSTETYEKSYYYEIVENTKTDHRPSSVKSKSLAWPPPKPIEDITYPTASPLYIDPNPALDRRSRQAVKEKKACIEACEKALTRGQRRGESTDREVEKVTRQCYRFEGDPMDRVSCPGPVYRKVELVETTSRQSKTEVPSRASSAESVRRSLTPTRIVQPVPKPWTATVTTGSNIYEQSYAGVEPPKVCKKFHQKEICQKERICERNQPFHEEHRMYRSEFCRREQTISQKPPLPTQQVTKQEETREETTEIDKQVIDLRSADEDEDSDGIKGEHDFITEMSEEDIDGMHVKTKMTLEKTVEPSLVRPSTPAVKESREETTAEETVEETLEREEEVCMRRTATKVEKEETEEKTVVESAEVVTSAVDVQQLVEKAKQEEEERKREEEEEEKRKQEEAERKRREEEERWRKRREEEERRRQEEEEQSRHVTFEEEEEEVEEVREQPLGRTVVREERVTEAESDTPGRTKLIKETYEEITEEVLVQERVKRKCIEDERKKSLREQVEVHKSLRDQQAPKDRRVCSKYPPAQEIMESNKKRVQFMKQTDTGPKPIPHSALQNSTPKEWKSEMVNALTTAPDRPFTPLMATRRGAVESHTYEPNRTPTPTPGRKSPAYGPPERPSCYVRAQAPRIREDPPSTKRSSIHFPTKKTVSYKVDEDTDDGHRHAEYAASKTVDFDEKRTDDPGKEPTDAVHAAYQEKRYMTSEETSEEKMSVTRRSLEVTEDFERCEKRVPTRPLPERTEKPREKPPKGVCAIGRTSPSQPSLPCPLSSQTGTSSPQPIYSSSTEVRHVSYGTPSSKPCPDTGVTVLPCKAQSDQGTKAGVVVVPCEGPNICCQKSGVCIVPTPDRSGVCVSPCFGGTCGQPSGTGVGGLGGAGSKSGTFAGSSAPKRGRGILNQASGPGSRLPLCAHCNSYVRGPFITALGQIWCPDHFVCVNTQCRRPLQDIGFVEEKGQLYCEYCFERFIAPSCNKCNNKIKGDCLNAIGKHFHPECFKCTYCGKLFGNSPFFLEEGLPYCEADWNELFTTKCFACGFPVEAGDRWVEALNNNYHSQCFNCTMCKKNLEGQSFYAKGGRPFCKNHAR
ncbi:PDZ and LIM domain protein Zasp [Melipona quadrifasciata]|uniref:PDZ and LIM domain protein Zasp n=1 Tax=Melipona quadrifasciata TaxID=166423 RepID=A0A0M9A876_9HYME|nr:PDZ and LIM domain protein Zasp [Melipona quadrifasciata]